MRLLLFSTPLAALAALGVFTAIQADGARQVSAAEQEVLADMDPFADPAVVELARRTAFVGTARGRAPHITHGLADAQVVALAEQVCRELTSGVTSDDLGIRQRYDGRLRAEASAVVQAAHAAYCPRASLSSVTIEGTLS